MDSLAAALFHYYLQFNAKLMTCLGQIVKSWPSDSFKPEGRRRPELLLQAGEGQRTQPWGAQQADERATEETAAQGYCSLPWGANRPRKGHRRGAQTAPPPTGPHLYNHCREGCSLVFLPCQQSCLASKAALPSGTHSSHTAATVGRTTGRR